MHDKARHAPTKFPFFTSKKISWGACPHWLIRTKCLPTDDQMLARLLSSQVSDSHSAQASIQPLLNHIIWETADIKERHFLITVWFCHLLPHIWSFLDLFTCLYKRNFLSAWSLRPLQIIWSKCSPYGNILLPSIVIPPSPYVSNSFEWSLFISKSNSVFLW